MLAAGLWLSLCSGKRENKAPSLVLVKHGFILRVPFELRLPFYSVFIVKSLYQRSLKQNTYMTMIQPDLSLLYFMLNLQTSSYP
jgi:hypothetical protein